MPRMTFLRWGPHEADEEAPNVVQDMASSVVQDAVAKGSLRRAIASWLRCVILCAGAIVVFFGVLFANSLPLRHFVTHWI